MSTGLFMSTGLTGFSICRHLRFSFRLLVFHAFLCRHRQVQGRDVPDPDTGIRYPVVSFIRQNFTGYLPDNISVFEIGETGVKTLEREFKSCLTGLTSRTFICGLPDLFQFYLNQWKHIHVLFKFQL